MNIVRSVSRTLLGNINSHLRVSVRHHNFDGDVFQRTEINMLSKEDTDVLYLETYSQLGFKLSNGFRIMGPCILFPKSILHWNVSSVEDINENSLSLFPLLEPKLDLLVLGIGDYGAKYDIGIVKFLRSKKINIEILATDQACATFNFLNSERRYVAAALIPPSYLCSQYEEDLMTQAVIERDKLFEFDEDIEKQKELSRSLFDNTLEKAKAEAIRRLPNSLLSHIEDKKKQNNKKKT